MTIPIPKSTTSYILSNIVMRDTNGNPLGSLAYTDVTVKVIDKSASVTTLTLVAGTLGTFVSSGWAETAASGTYQLGVPNTHLAGDVGDVITIHITPTSGGPTITRSIVLTPVDANNEIMDTLTEQLIESYAAQGVVPNLIQLLFEIRSHLAESTISGTTKTTKKIDGSTTATTSTLDSASAPTSITRST